MPYTFGSFYGVCFILKYEDDNLILSLLTYPGYQIIFKRCKILNENFDYSLLDNIYEGYDFDVSNITINTDISIL